MAQLGRLAIAVLVALGTVLYFSIDTPQRAYAHGFIDQASLAFPASSNSASPLPDSPAFLSQTFTPTASALVAVDLGLGAFQPEVCDQRNEDITLTIVWKPPVGNEFVLAQTTKNVAADLDSAEKLIITHFDISATLVVGAEYELRVSGSNCLHLWVESDAPGREFVFATYSASPAPTTRPNLGGIFGPLPQRAPAVAPAATSPQTTQTVVVSPPRTGDGGLK